ncbi:hypothetical protein BOO71_0007363 [Deinococcus marmoris]|uniref:Uncharacterized protein n=1 Tax=Deinococcus marmoris TaxID=249408 RepID=A0A1U7NYV6_9DEIO|nr:hypothetical protein BOO71_0007363 [Deinococcus marmoris]
MLGSGIGPSGSDLNASIAQHKKSGIHLNADRAEMDSRPYGR